MSGYFQERAEAFSSCKWCEADKIMQRDWLRRIEDWTFTKRREHPVKLSFWKCPAYLVNNIWDSGNDLKSDSKYKRSKIESSERKRFRIGETVASVPILGSDSK